jgi:hypothetical protein
MIMSRSSAAPITGQVGLTAIVTAVTRSVRLLNNLAKLSPPDPAEHRGS